MKQYRWRAYGIGLMKKLSEAQMEEAKGISKSLSEVMKNVRKKINDKKKVR